MASSADQRLDSLRRHLMAENPDLVGLVQTYAKMDALLRRMRLIGTGESLADRIGWWPVISFVGLYSAGKSTLINDFLGQPVQRTGNQAVDDNPKYKAIARKPVQRTGNQAVDDKFTVLCHGPELRELPGTALDADVRFPFHGMSHEIEKAAPGEGRMVDRFMALKTVPSDFLRGLVLVDSPGFDSDEYRAATLRLIDHILDLSDLTLVLFDARKPEPGVMRDTLDKLVARVKDRPDANKFLFVLNQIDATAREDNLEEVVGAWQRALAGVGITGGRFYAVYSDRAAGEGAEVTPRLREISRRDMADIQRRIQEVPGIRGYRVATGLEAVSKDVRELAVPMITDALRRWGRVTGQASVAAVLAGILLVVGLGLMFGDPAGLVTLPAPWPWVVLGLVVLASLAVRFLVGRISAGRIARRLPERVGGFGLSVRQAFLAATRLPLVLRQRPLGWSRATRRRLESIHAIVANEIRRMNDRFASPGERQLEEPPPAAAGSPDRARAAG